MKTSRGLLRTPQRVSQARTARKSRGPSIVLSGKFLAAHRDEILARVRACERAENRGHPLQRIIELRGGTRDVRVTTTDEHLARRIGEALYAAYKGELEYRYNRKHDLLRVTWCR